MSRLQFRAWDALSNPPRMIRDTEEVLGMWDSGIAIMQFTGREDMDGTKIYEGDVVEAMMCFGPGGFHKKKVVIRWDETYGYQWNYFLWCTIKVIGNIYENPELLKEVV